MGIEIPESYGGAGGSFFHSVLAVEELSRVDPSVGVLVDVQNTLVINALLRWGNDDLKRRYLPKLAGGTRRRVRAVGGGLGQRRVCADDARARVVTDGDGYVAHRPQALDHQRERGGHLPRLRDRRSRGGLPRHHRVRRRARLSRASPSARRKTSSASAPAARASCILDDCRVPRANVLGEVGKGYKTAIETLNEGRIGIGAQMIGLARGRARSRHPVHEGTQAVRQGDRRVPGRPASARARGGRRRSRAADGLQRGAPARRRASRSSPKRRSARSSRRKSPSVSRRWP